MTVVRRRFRPGREAARGRECAAATWAGNESFCKALEAWGISMLPCLLGLRGAVWIIGQMAISPLIKAHNGYGLTTGERAEYPPSGEQARGS